MSTNLLCPQCGGHLTLLSETRSATCDRCEWAIEVPEKKKSERELLTERIIEYIEGHHATFKAPYGVLNNLEKLPRGGAVRTVTFGCARILDATLNIWGLQKITLNLTLEMKHSIPKMKFIVGSRDLPGPIVSNIEV